MGQLTWSNQTITTGISWGRMAVNPATGTIITCSVSTGAKISRDGGVTWTTLDNTGGIPSITGGVGFGGGTWLVQTAQNVIYRSTNDGTSWTVATTEPTFTSNDYMTFVFSPTLGTGSGMWLASCPSGPGNVLQFSTSSDGGNTWTAAATITGSNGTRPSVFKTGAWDGTNFCIIGRDTGNLNSCIFTSSDGSTWTNTVLGSIFATQGEGICIDFTNGVYTVGFGSKPFYRRATTLSGLTSGGVDLSTSMTGCTKIAAIAASPTGVMTVLIGQQNTVGAAPDIAEILNTGVTNLDTSPQGTNNYMYGCVYDPVHLRFVATGAGSVGCALNTGQFSETPVVNVSPASVTLPSGSGNVLLTATTLNPPNAPIIWLVNGIVNGNPTVGTINNGYYVAPAVPTTGTVTITAVHAFSPSTTAAVPITFSGHVPPPVTDATREQNYTAPAGFGGDRWGAAGGGIAPVGVSKSFKAALGTAERLANYIPSVAPTVAPGPDAVQNQASTGALSVQTADVSIGHGGTRQGAS